MSSIAFIDTEIEPKSGKILDIGAVRNDGSTFHQNSMAAFIQFLSGTQYICGHNILNHDLRYIGKDLTGVLPAAVHTIDTLFLSPLLFPTRPYHSLLKDDKLQSDEINNPLNDAIKARDLFYDEIAAFDQADESLKQIFYLLLKDRIEFRSFFRFIHYNHSTAAPEQLIRQKFDNEICANAKLSLFISEFPVELAYSLALIHSFIHYQKIHSITPPWVLKTYPEVERIMFSLRNRPCISGCTYCDQALDIHQGLKRFFGFDSFRNYGGEPLQEKAVRQRWTINPFSRSFPREVANLLPSSCPP